MQVAALRAIAGLFALSWIVVPGFGAIDLAVTWSSDWLQVLEAGWGCSPLCSWAQPSRS